MGKSLTVLPQEKLVRGELVTVDEASKITHLGKTSLYACAKTGKIRYFRPMKGKMLFDTEDLYDWLRNGEVPAGTVLGNI